MATKPLSFSDEMIRAVRGGLKRETRRVLRWAHEDHRLPPHARTAAPDGWATHVLPARESGWIAWWSAAPRERLAELTVSEYDHGLSLPHAAGDTLWLQEAWRVVWRGSNRALVDYRATGCRLWAEIPESHLDKPTSQVVLRWWPARFMPEWASRSSVKVLDSWPERVQEITAAGIRAEGVDCPEHDDDGCLCVSECAALRGAFRALWDKLNAARGYGWQTNPWVAVTRFEETK